MDTSTVGVAVTLSLALWDMLRIWRHEPPRRRIDLLSMAFWATGSVVAAELWGPGWLVVTAWTVAAVCAVGAVLAFTVDALVRPVPVVGAEQLRQQLLAELGPDGPQEVVLGVSSTGFVAVRAARQEGLRLGAARLERGCPFCFLEEILTEAAQDADAAIGRYRSERARGVNGMAVLTRGAADARRRAEILPMTGNSKPFQALCATHALR